MIRNPYPFRYLTDWAYDMLLGTDEEVAQGDTQTPTSTPYNDLSSNDTDHAEDRT